MSQVIPFKPKNLETLQILVIDDDNVDRALIKRKLAPLATSWNVIEAPDATQGRIILAQQNVDCIILDHLLPDANGLELLQLWQQQEIDIPVIITTGYGDELLAVDMMKAGAANYLPKSKLTGSLLYQAITSAIRYKAVERQVRQAEASLLRLSHQHELILQSVGDALFGIDLDEHLTFMNPAAIHLFQQSSYQVLDHAISQWIDTEKLSSLLCKAAHIKNKPASEQLIIACLTPETEPITIEIDWPLTRQDNPLFDNEVSSQSRPMELTISPIVEGRALTGAVFVCKEISKRKTMETALKQASQKAWELTRLKSSFLANMSHEIRSPLNGIIGMMHLVLHSPLTSEQHEHLEMGQRSAEHLLTIVNDLLDFSKIESGKFTIEHTQFSLPDLLKDTLHPLKLRAEQKELLWTETPLPKSLPPYFTGDPARLRQVLQNLVDNAIKFTDTGEILISVQAKADENEEWHFTLIVEDSGIGIAEEKRNNLFQPFMQADDSINRQYGGTGLGLSISYQLSQMMNGRLWCEARKDEQPGTRFIFEFSLPQASIKNTETAFIANNIANPDFVYTAITPKAANQCRFLIVEDQRVNQKLLSHLLTQRGCQVAIANHGEEAIQLFQKSLETGDFFDAVLMDVQMPVLDGYKATQAIRVLETDRADRSQTAVPIIALTAHAYPEDKHKCLRAGMSHYLSKPIRPEQLFQLLNSLFRHPSFASNTHDPVNESNGSVSTIFFPEQRPHEGSKSL
ncbi:MAG: response regulator [Cyanobacteria bacterium]|nr:response regulator [Cyanobacteriota bacterium]